MNSAPGSGAVAASLRLPPFNRRSYFTRAIPIAIPSDVLGPPPRQNRSNTPAAGQWANPAAVVPDPHDCLPGLGAPPIRGPPPVSGNLAALAIMSSSTLLPPAPCRATRKTTRPGGKPSSSLPARASSCAVARSPRHARCQVHDFLAERQLPRIQSQRSKRSSTIRTALALVAPPGERLPSVWSFAAGVQRSGLGGWRRAGRATRGPGSPALVHR